MALWRWNNLEWEKTNWHMIDRPGRAVLYGCAPSLNDADLIEPGAMRFVQNMGYKKVEPHVWLGMDKPGHFGPDIFNQPCRKILRGNFSLNKVDGNFARDYGDTYFADMETDKSSIWYSRGIDVKFLWTKNTMTIALHVILWMGFKEIVFFGIDLKGGYFDGKTVLDKKRHELLFSQEFAFLKDFAANAEKQGIKLINRSKSSRLAEIMETKIN